jgi:hypothetical protein
MYKITRKAHVKEELQICYPDGTPAFVLPVDLDMDVLGGKVREAIATVGQAQERLKKDPQDAEAFGTALVALFNVLFGEEGTAKLLSFYENNYLEMLIDVYPFIQSEIIPKVQAASMARKEKLLQYAPKKKGFFR